MLRVHNMARWHSG